MPQTKIERLIHEAKGEASIFSIKKRVLFLGRADYKAKNVGIEVSNKEAFARIKINKLLEAAGWRFFPSDNKPANIRLEPSVTIKKTDLDAFGDNFEKTSKGYIDFLLLDSKGFPFIVLEAKAEDKNPLIGKEQARKYARSQNCRFVILSNGNLHYFWDLERGNPYLVTSFPTPDSVMGYQKVTPNPQRLIEEKINEDYIVLTQRPNYQSEAAWKNEAERPGYIQANKLRFLRSYQLQAIYALQRAVQDGKDRFLFEMATGTGKTLTAGYDCPDILNLGLFRPTFSPTDFIQIKGRGTRKHNFQEQLFDSSLKEGVRHPQKTAYMLFDFFANCEYFETDFNYDEVLKLPKPSKKDTETDGGTGPVVVSGLYEHLGADIIASLKEETIGYEGMKIDRMFFEKFGETVRENETIAKAVEAGQWDRVIDYINREVFDKPEEYYTLEKLRKAASVDRRLTLREILEKVFGFIPRFKSRDELLEEEFTKFVADYKPGEADALPAIKNYFKAYATSDQIRHIIDHKQFTDLATNPNFSTRDFKEVPPKYRTLIPEYIKDYVSLNQFAA